MIGHYVSMALRSFKRNPFATAVNVFTLALGLACFLVAYAIVGYWDRAERAYPNADRTFVVTADLEASDGSISTGVNPVTNGILAKYLKTDFPKLEQIARARSGSETSFSAGDVSLRLYLGYADPEFLTIFDLPFIHGDPKTALEKPNSVILTEASAMKLFGKTDVVGQPLLISSGVDTTVTGVVAALPQPSHMGDSSTALMRFDILAPWDMQETFNKISQQAAARNAPKPQGGDKAAPAQNPPPTPPQRPENWLGGYCCTTYAMLPKDGSLTAEEFKARLKDFGNRRVPPQQKALASVAFGAVPVSGVLVTSLNSVLFGSGPSNLSVTTLLFLLGGLVLSVACLNYANLATAQTSLRAAEVGLRKVVGANRGQVLLQHLIEAGLLTLAALIVAFIAIESIVPVLRTAANIDLNVAMFAGFWFWGFIVALIVGVTLLAGAYPAFILSGVRPVTALRGTKSGGGPRFVPMILVGVQFAAASFLLIAVIVMYRQNSDLRQTGLGASKDPIVVIANASQFTGVKPDVLRNELKRIPEVVSVAGVGQQPWSRGVSLVPLSKTPELSSAQYTAITASVDYNYFPLMDIPVLAGRNFDEAHGDDKMPQNGIMGLSTDRPGHVVIDETFAKDLGFSTPSAAAGKVIYLSAKMLRMIGRQDGQPLRVIGVVADRPQRFKGIGANGTIYFLGENQTYQLVRLKANGVADGLKAINSLWKRQAPRIAISLTFMDELFDRNFEVYSDINTAFTGLSIFALVISVIGLFGMAIRVTSRRIREIGVRKTLGASTGQIVAMLLKDFSKPVIVANIIAWPLGFLAGQVYLSFFIHRISLSPLPFAISFVLTVLIAWVAVGGQAIRAARVKPAMVLRYE